MKAVGLDVNGQPLPTGFPNPSEPPFKPKPVTPSDPNGDGVPDAPTFGVPRQIGAGKNAAETFVIRRGDPLVFDLDGDGVELVQASDSQAYFDLDANGSRERTGWVASDDGILVLDHNGDGSANDINDLFGTLQTSGFDVLKQYDANGDGKIDSADAVFSKLKIWRDLNQDGLTQAGELTALGTYNIASISLASNPVVQQPVFDEWGNDITPPLLNTRLTDTSTFTRTDGTTGVVGNAIFERQLLLSRYNGSVTVSSEASTLSNLRGFGTMPDLQIAATLDPDLASQMRSLLASPTRQDFMNGLDNVLYRWAGAQNVDPLSRWNGDVTSDDVFDARKLATIEAFTGDSFVRFGQPNADWVAKMILDPTWDALRDHFGSRLLVLGGPMSNMFPSALYSTETDNLILNQDARNLGLQLATLRDNGNSRFASELSFVQMLMRNSADMVNDDVIFGTDVNGGVWSIAKRTAFIETGDLSDNIYSAAGNALVYAGEGDNSVEISGDGEKTVFSGSGNDYVGLGNGNATVDLGGGDNTVIGSNGDYLITTSLGDDTIYVNNGSSTIFAGNGTNYVYAGNGSHLILSGSGNDAISVGNGNSTIIAGDGTNSIQAGDGFQQISTGSGDDDINLGSGGSVVDAGDGNNTIYGVGGDYVISAGSGNDIIILGNGNSTVFLGDGLNALYGENGNYSVASGIGDDSITLGIGNSFVSSGAGNDSIIVSGGDCILQGEAGDDYISAGAGNTLLDGGSGNDTLIGGIGNNTYMFGHGYGQDTISDYDMTTGNADTIYLKPDVTPSDVTLWRDASNLYLGINGTDDKITVQSWYDDSVYRVEQVKFADGTVWNEAALAAAKLFSTGGDDVVLGSYCNDIVDGRAGNDYILGDAGNDSLDGGVGNDILDGGADNDILADATGNNLLMGGDGDDTMAAGGGNLFIGGSGNDSITLEGGAAVIAFNRGDGQDAANFGAVMESVTVTLGGGIDYTDLAFGKAGNDLILGTGVDESITMKDWFSSLAGHGMVTLQVLAESMPGFDPLSGDPLLSQKVQTFDFTSLATRFDAELAADPTMTSWNLMNGLLDAHLASSDASALGGDLAYQYGVNGVLTGVGLAVAQDVLASPQFGSQAQTLRPWSTLNGGTVQLG